MVAEISIVIPVYNRANIVRRTLDSVARQTLRPLDVILVDNNSSDNTLNVLNQWKQANQSDDFRIKVITELSPGASCARNRGLKEVTTPYVMFFDSDDVMHPHHVASFVDAFHQNRNIDVVGRNILHLMPNGKKSIKVFRKSLYQHIFHASFSTQRYAAKTELIRRVGAWDERMRGWDDYELGVRILTKATPQIKVLSGHSVTYFWQEQSLTGTDFSSRPHEWESALNQCEVSLRDAGVANRFIRYIELRRIVLAGHYRRENSSHAKRLFDEVLNREHNLLRRLFYHFAFRYVAAGGRGIAIFAPMMLR